MKITIPGGGVAGVASAAACTLHGHDTTVHERRGAGTDIGAGITMAGCGLAASLCNRNEAFRRERDRACRHADYPDLARAPADGWSRQLPPGA